MSANNFLTKMDWKIFGHDKIKTILEKQLENKRLSHAYLFLGAEGLGKKALALEFAKQILNTENLVNCTDFRICAEEGEIGIEKIRELIQFLSLTPLIGEKKVLIIDNAQNLNQQSGNALLKTLEEPALSSVIILIASGQPLKTIASRCQIFNFNLFSQKQLREFAEKEKIQADESLLNLSFGVPGRMKSLFQNPELKKEQAGLIGQFEAIEKMGVGEKLLQVSVYAAQEIAELEKIFLTWLWWKTGKLSEFPGDFLKVRALMEALISLKNNQNKKLILQGLFLKI